MHERARMREDRAAAHVAHHPLRQVELAELLQDSGRRELLSDRVREGGVAKTKNLPAGPPPTTK